MNGLKRIEIEELLGFDPTLKDLVLKGKRNPAAADALSNFKKSDSGHFAKRQFLKTRTKEEMDKLLLVQSPEEILVEESFRFLHNLRIFSAKDAMSLIESTGMLQGFTEGEIDEITLAYSLKKILAGKRDRILKQDLINFFSRWREKTLAYLMQRDSEPILKNQGTTCLSKDEVDEMLEVQTPREICERYKPRLNRYLIRHLKEREANPNFVDRYRESAREMGRMIAQAPESELGKIVEVSPKPRALDLFFKAMVRIPFPILLWSLSFALLIWVVLPSEMANPKGQSVAQTGFPTMPEVFERLLNEPGAELFDQALFEALKNRGIHFLKLAQKLGASKKSQEPPQGFTRRNKIQDYYQESVMDLGQALNLGQSDRDAKKFQAQAYTALVKLKNGEIFLQTQASKSVEPLKRMVGEPDTGPFDEDLFRALKNRGIYFFNQAEEIRTAKVFRDSLEHQAVHPRKARPYYNEAVTDLSQAFDLNRSDSEVENYLRKAMNRLDDLI